jgi:FKBP-type peptidyl-prolyl cis-trans isomerase
MLDAVQDAISEMYVGQKAQAMIPPQLGFCDKGLCGQEMG